MRKTVSISPALLPRALQERFEAMLPVVARRSIVQWDLRGAECADVVLRVHGPSGDEQVTVYVSEAPACEDAQGALRLERDFRVSALMEVLDLAAARVLDRRDHAARAAQRAGVDHAANIYQLKYWVVQDRRWPMRVLCALAGMTRRPVSRQWLVNEARLSAEEVDSMLVQLELRGALRTGHAALADSAPPAATGVAARLKSWLRRGRAASSSLSMAK